MAQAPIAGMDYNKRSISDFPNDYSNCSKQCENQDLVKSHDYKSLIFRKDTKPFSFAEDKLRRMWLCRSVLSYNIKELIEEDAIGALRLYLSI